jgi:acyl-coenzyme A synthetase/AMP-(fatty) acid ligase
MKRQLCFVMAMMVAQVAVLAQAPTLTAPPIKMGLWQTTTTSTMSGITLPPEVVARLQAAGRPVPGSQPHTTVTQSCATQEKWQKMFSDFQQNKDCQFSNVKQSSAAMSADIACKSMDGSRTSTGHLDVAFVSSDKMTGKVRMETIVASQPKPINMDMSFDSAYQGSDCKGVSPDSAKVVH